jgi:hypothetical protein
MAVGSISAFAEPRQGEAGSLFRRLALDVIGVLVAAGTLEETLNGGDGGFHAAILLVLLQPCPRGPHEGRKLGGCEASVPVGTVAAVKLDVLLAVAPGVPVASGLLGGTGAAGESAVVMHR